MALCKLGENFFEPMRERVGNQSLHRPPQAKTTSPYRVTVTSTYPLVQQHWLSYAPPSTWTSST